MDQLKMYIDKGIYYSIIESDTTIDIDDAQKIVEQRNRLFNGKNYPGYFDIGKLRYESKEAREYLAKYGSKGISASAIIANTPISRVFISVYLGVYPPQMPCKVFTDKSKAIDWLQQFVG